jgi:hypothetical protein
MDPTKEQRMCVKFCASILKGRAETLAVIRQGKEALAAYGCLNGMLGSGLVKHPLNDDQHTGRPISSTTPNTVAKLQHLIHEDRHRTIQDLADEMELGYGICHWILTAELGMYCVAAIFVPRILIADQNVCTELRKNASYDATFLSRVITGDESCLQL